jgi:hypothetical protein
MRTRYTHFSPRLTLVLLALGACDDADPDITKEDRQLLNQCVVETDWTPDGGYLDHNGEFIGLIEVLDCIVVPVEEVCPDPATVRGIANSCATSKAVCVTGFEGRHEDVRDTGQHTGEPRDFSAFDRCCYTYVGVRASYVCGRPWLVAGRGTTAPIRPGAGWCAPRDERSPPHAAALAVWTEDAASEHASIAAFAALTLDLLAHGFPARLLERAASAQAEEVAHARGALEIASRLAGRPLAPGPLPVGRVPPGLVQLAVDAAVLGGLGESLAAAIAAARLAVCTDPLTRAHLSRVAQDEARHAALAWEIVEHAIAVGGEQVAEAVHVALAQAVEQKAREAVSTEPCVPAHGLCGDEALTLARDHVLREVFGWRVAA